MRIVNLTGEGTGRKRHVLRLTDGRNIVVIRPTGQARVISDHEIIAYVNVDGLDRPLPVTQLVAKEVVGLPDPQPDTLFVVSGLVASLLPDRLDVVTPGRTERHPDSGDVVGARGFVKSIRGR